MKRWPVGQRVIYTGVRFPQLENGAEGWVSQLQSSNPPAPGWVKCEFPGCTPREHEVPERDLEAIGQRAINPGSRDGQRELEQS